MSSLLLTKHMEKESTELKKYIGSFLEEKVIEFSETLKDKIGQFVNSRMLSFCNRPQDTTLFDSDGESILRGVEDSFKKRNWVQLLQEYKPCIQQKNKRCFHIPTQDSAYFFFENCVVVTGQPYLYACSDESGLRFTLYHHSLSSDVLRALKHFQLNRPGNLEQGLSMYRLHPEFFHSNSTDFEEIFAKEYQEIYEKKKLEKILEERGTIEEERQKLAEEKKQWILVKQKITRMHLDLAKERSLFEKFRRKIELDDFLEVN